MRASNRQLGYGRRLVRLLVCLAFLIPPGAAVAQQAAADTTGAATETAEPDTNATDPAVNAPTSTDESGEGPWLLRTLHRYFGDANGDLDQLQGRALETSSQYERYAGLPIEVIIVHPVLSFSEGWDGDRSTANRLLNDLASPLQSYTRDGVIRSYLLFDAGDRLDPFALADTERLLRDLPFIADVRILVVKLTGLGDDTQQSVAVIVEPMDRWPLGISGKIKTRDLYSLKFFSVNVLGTGLGLENELLVNRNAVPEVGYRGRLRKENLGGTFIDVETEFEDSYSKLRRGALIERRLIHPGVDAIGGLSWERFDDRENEGKPRKFDHTDAWLGHVIRLFDPRDNTDLARPLLVPAVRYVKRDFLVRPTTTADSNRNYHDSSMFLAGISLQRFKYYKTSYLFGDGETEDLPSGIILRLSGGYENREYERRTGIFFDTDWLSLRNRGDVAFASLAVGGFLHKHRLEDGVLDIGGGYYSHLLGGHSYRYRLAARLRYTLGLGRHRFDQIYLDDEAGLRGMGSGAVAGNQRLVANLESRLFTPWSVLGFRFSCFGFTDIGLIGGEDASSLFKEKVYVSVGLGARLRNPDLVLPTIQVRLALLNNISESGVRLQFKIGNAPYPQRRVAGAKPGPVAYR